jgi:hypothetical protein
MTVYKVLFFNNIPIASEPDGHAYKGSSEFDHYNGKLMIRSLEVIADNERESMIIAGQFARDCLKKMLMA